MTEIPEHLLKRSKERRAAIGGEEAPAGDVAATSEAVEPATPAAAPAPVASTPPPAPVPEPVRPEVAAAMGRKKIPFWAMPVLAALPLWAYVYQATLEPAPTGELTPVQEGGQVYVSSACVGCHQAGGGGNAGAPGLEEVESATFPDFRDHLMWVRIGNAGWYEAAGEEVYGADAKPSNDGTMPAHPTLTEQQLAQVVLYERVQFGGMEEEGEEYELLLEIAEGTKTFADAGVGPLSEAIGLTVDDLASG